MMSRLDIALLVALGLAVGLAALGALRAPGDAVVALPLLDAGDPPGSLHAPGAPARALQGRLAAVGDVLTIEDLARGVLALEQGQLPGVDPLPADVRADVAARLAATNARREALLALETRMAAEDAALRQEALALAASLSPEQRAWVAAQRDIASVAGVERVYWDALLGALADASSPALTAAPPGGGGEGPGGGVAEGATPPPPQQRGTPTEEGAAARGAPTSSPGRAP